MLAVLPSSFCRSPIGLEVAVGGRVLHEVELLAEEPVVGADGPLRVGQLQADALRRSVSVRAACITASRFGSLTLLERVVEQRRGRPAVGDDAVRRRRRRGAYFATCALYSFIASLLAHCGSFGSINGVTLSTPLPLAPAMRHQRLRRARARHVHERLPARRPELVERGRAREQRGAEHEHVRVARGEARHLRRRRHRSRCRSSAPP